MSSFTISTPLQKAEMDVRLRAWHFGISCVGAAKTHVILEHMASLEADINALLARRILLQTHRSSSLEAQPAEPSQEEVEIISQLIVKGSELLRATQLIDALASAQTTLEA